MIAIQKHRNQLALLLVAVSFLALVPTLTSATQPVQLGTLEFGTIAINATGQATPLDKGKGSPSPATLSLNGTANEQGFGGLGLDHLRGFLLIGSTNYTILDGQGEVNKNGDAQINAQVNDGKHWNWHWNELDLHGSIQGTSAVFSSPQSKLSSLYFLSLTGEVSLALHTVSFSSKSHKGPHFGEEENETITVTQTLNNTVTETSNQTVTQTVTVPQNVTVTITEHSNSTIVVTTTQTEANTTITETKNVTTTVANTTITTTVSK